MPVPVTNEALAERIESVIVSVNRVARAVEIQNGRVSAIELARAKEQGEREAVAAAAASTAAALVQATSLKDKSHTWKLGVVAAIIGAVGVASTSADVFSHYLFHH